MKALSLDQPWASLVVSGIKRIETRSWRTTHRGPLAIAATRRTDRHALRALRHVVVVPEHVEALRSIREWPNGAVVGLVEVVDCQPVERFWDLDDQLPYCDFEPGRFGWVLERPRVVAPIPCRGRQRLWELPKEVKERLMEALG